MRKKPHRLPKEEQESIRENYRRGRSVPWLADRYGRDPKTIRRILGAEYRPQRSAAEEAALQAAAARARKSPDEGQIAAMRRMHKSGASITQIAAQLGYHTQTVSKYVRLSAGPTSAKRDEQAARAESDVQFAQEALEASKLDLPCTISFEAELSDRKLVQELAQFLSASEDAIMGMLFRHGAAAFRKAVGCSPS